MNKVLCWFLGHRWFVIKRFSADCRKVGCRRCGAVWGMNDRVEALVEWDWELEAMHERNELL
jgi:hypothetical protein